MEEGGRRNTFRWQRPGLSRKKPPASPPPPPPPLAVDRMMHPSPSPSSPRPVPSWVLLDRFVHRSRRRRGVFEGDPTTSAMAEDCTGRPVRVSLRSAAPPAVSRLYLHWTGRPPFTNANAVAAHRHAVLFSLTVPVEDPEWWRAYCCFPVDYFVYSAATSPPSLTRLPPCFEGGFVNPKLDKPFRPYRRQQQRCMWDQDMGILCHGDGDGGEFTVAELTHGSPREVELCVLHHPSPASSSGTVPMQMQWRVQKIPVPPDMKINPSLWTTDAIFPLDGCLCWVDYYQGLLLVDVLLANNHSNQQEQLRYIPLPKQALRSRRYYIDAGSPDPFRHVSVTDAGIVKLVCIFTKHSSSMSNNFTIITWSFDIRKGTWTKDCGNTVEFFGMFDDAVRSSRLPRVTPSFPVVSLADPDVICFILEEVLEDLSVVYWMIEVHMRNKVLRSTTRYMREEEEEGYYPGKPSRKFYGQYFIPSKFLSYLAQDGCTSR